MTQKLKLLRNRILRFLNSIEEIGSIGYNFRGTDLELISILDKKFKKAICESKKINPLLTDDMLMQIKLADSDLLARYNRVTERLYKFGSKFG